MFLVLDGITCESSSVLQIFSIIKNVLNIICIAAPILLIVSCLLDGVKIVKSKDPNPGTLFKKIIRKSVAAAIVLLMPTIVNITMDIVDGIKLTDQKCWSEATKENIAALRATENKELEENEKNMPGGSAAGQGDTSKDSTLFKLKRTSIVLAHTNKYVDTYGVYTIEIVDRKNKAMKSSDFKFESSNPAIASVSSSGKIKAKFGGTATITITDKKNSSNKKTVNVVVVQPLYVNAKLNSTVKAKNIKTGKTKTLSKGTTGVLNGFSRKISDYVVGNTLKVGSDYYTVSASNVTATSYSIPNMYSQQIVEDFINTYKFKSNTKYFFWINQGTQTCYMFTGSVGRWKLYRTFYINTGDAMLLTRNDGSLGHNGITGNFRYYTVGGFKSGLAFGYKMIYRKTLSGSNNENVWHGGGTGKRYPASFGCTRFRTDNGDLQYLIKINSQIKGSMTLYY